ncbi:MAG: hypothetical protein KDA72_04225 [Planctomycetales bacterium]|nr:hypothetical protein [Planctomycetales bacterium]
MCGLANTLIHKLPAGRNRVPRRRGATLVLSVILLFGLFSFVAFSIDLGYLAQSRAEIQRSADAAAMAGCWELYAGMERGNTIADSQPAARQAAADFSLLNPVCRSGPILDPSVVSQDVQIGYFSNPRNAVLSNDSSQPYFGVQALVSRTSVKNGEIPFFFGKIFGDSGIPMQSSATAVMAQKISGFSLPPSSTETIQLLPFALDLQTWQSLVSGTVSDQYAYNAASEKVNSGQDGIGEVNLYPQGTGSPGNRGTVDIGGANNSTNDIARQIIHGISAQDLIDLGKPLNLDPNVGLTLNGDTGISAGVKDELTSIIGQKRVIPIFSSVSGNGNNATYSIVRWVGVRIMHVKLTGAMSGKQLIVQPAPMIASHAIVATTGGASSDFILSPVMLAR